ncbi:BEN domain-containing protein 2 isoform X2 [Bombina bombina]|uniref:BEN domain-containing protein 2 isoform X2 n=1 Tax=Bombina bombina TaxID=8345 RepID=UPI00235B2595|nr:BEN domain-containing protein 2 isoform X2 [Bombina bombina]
MSSRDFITVKVEDDDDEPVIIESSSLGGSQTGLKMQTMLERDSQATEEHHYLSQISYEGEDLSSSIQTDNSTDEMDYGLPHKRRRVPSMLENNTMGNQAQEFDNGGNVPYDYDVEYDGASVMSEGSYMGDQRRILTEVLNYCQAMYDTIQKLDKKFDVLQRKVSEMHHARMRPHIKPRPLGIPYRNSLPLNQGKIKLQKLNERTPSLHMPPPPQGPHNPLLGIRRISNLQIQPSSTIKAVPSVPPKPDLQRRSPPLPTIISTHSLQPSFTLSSSKNVDQNLSQTVVEAMPESTCSVSSPSTSTSLAPAIRPTSSEASIVISEEQPSSSVPTNPGYEFLGNPSRNIKIPGTLLIKARQKTKPKYAARYLIRVLFPKEVLVCSSMGKNSQGLRVLDIGKVTALREFLESAFPAFDLGEYGKDWKTCVTYVNTMIRCLRCEARNQAKNFAKQAATQDPEDSICVDSDANEEDEEDVLPVETSPVTQNTASSTTAKLLNSQKDNKETEPPLAKTPEKQSQSDPMEFLGESWRNVKLPFSVIYIGKGKIRPELSARYLIRHLFTEDVLVKSNVYGNLERGIVPLDCNKISALRDFLQKTYPSFDLKESGYDWKACVAAINSTIRSLRHDQKKGITQPRNKIPNRQQSSSEQVLQHIKMVSSTKQNEEHGS